MIYIKNYDIGIRIDKEKSNSDYYYQKYIVKTVNLQPTIMYDNDKWKEDKTYNTDENQK